MDGTDMYKLEVSLPGGRYQLSLDDRAVNTLRDGIGLETRDTVPEAFVPFFVAVGDAWFPNERDTERILSGLEEGKALSDREREVLIEYVTESLIPEAREDYVRDVLADSLVADAVSADDLEINELPDPERWFGSTETRAESTDVDPTTDASTTATASEESSDGQVADRLTEIPGIGPERAARFSEAGITSLAEIADSRPADLTTIQGISEGIAGVAVEGAREVLNERPPASERLAAQTGRDRSEFGPTLRSLAAAGVPPTETTNTLRVLYGPTVANVDGVTGMQAYYLWEAGYETPKDLVDATDDELTEIYGVGETTAPEIRESARNLLSTANR